MSGLILIILLLLIFFVFVLPVLALNRSTRALREVEGLQREWAAWRTPASRIRGDLQPDASPGVTAIREMPETSYGMPRKPPEAAGRAEDTTRISGPGPDLTKPSISAPRPAAVPQPVPPSLPETSANPPGPPSASVPPLPVVPASRRPLNLEQFLGVKLFAWVGGFALFLGVVFFVKYAFERNLIPPAVRTAMGFATGLALTGGGLMMHRKRSYEVLSRTLCATGMLVLYAVTFAAHALYKFPLFSAAPTFLLMAVITACSFLLAVRLRALEVAFLGLLGGFLAPVLCSTGQDNPAALFTSTALLDIGLLAVARRCRWPFLAAFAALGTILTQFGWAARFIFQENYDTGWKTWIAAAVFLAFPAIFTGALRFEKPEDEKHMANEGPQWLGGSALALLGGGMLAAFLSLSVPGIAARPVLLHGFVLLTQILVMTVGWMRPALARSVAAGGAVTLWHLLLWTKFSLTAALLPLALGSYLIAGVAHVAFAVIWERRKGGVSALSPAVPWIPAAVQILTVLPVLQLNPVPAVLWPFLLGLNVLGIGLAASRKRLFPVILAGGVTLLNGMFWLKALPPDPASIAFFPPALAVYILVLLPALLWLGRHAGPEDGDLAAALPAIAAAAPFALLMTAAASIPLVNPAPVFLVALLLTAILLWLTEKDKELSGILPAVALGCMLGLQTVWLLHSWTIMHPATALSWQVGIHLVFVLWPCLRRRQLEGRALPWAVSAVSGIGHFLLVYTTVRWSALNRFYPDNLYGLLPLAFSVPPLLGLAAAQRGLTLPGKSRLNQLAWFGGVALFFITVAVPVQFRREWITLSWALEGAALCWLFRRLPHPGLKLTGAVLLTVAFVRMGLNPLVFQYHEVSRIPLLNWHLYGYGLTAAAQFAAAWWLAPPHHRWQQVPLRAVLTAFGGILLFLLVNVQIASFFTPEGSRFITFEFHGNFARDMVTTIAWGLFALGLMIIGFRWRQPAPRYAGVGLLAVTLLKLFLHDLAQLGTIHRIGAFIAVAITALVASFLYQRFLNSSRPDNSNDPADGSAGSTDSGQLPGTGQPAEIPDPDKSPG